MPTPSCAARTPTSPCWCPTASPSPLTSPYRYGKHIASLSNMLGRRRAGPALRRSGEGGVRTNEHRLSKSLPGPPSPPLFPGPVPGPAQAAAGRHHRDDLRPGQDRPGTANHDTLLYGAEVKFYSARLKLSEEAGDAIPKLLRRRDGGRRHPGPGPGGAPPACRRHGPF